MWLASADIPEVMMVPRKAFRYETVSGTGTDCTLPAANVTGMAAAEPEPRSADFTCQTHMSARGMKHVASDVARTQRPLPQCALPCMQIERLPPGASHALAVLSESVIHGVHISTVNVG